MGISRSKLKRDREKIYSYSNDPQTVHFIKASHTIKHLKHSLSTKERKIKSLEEEIDNYKSLYSISKEYYSFMEYFLSLYRNLKENVRGDLKSIDNRIEEITSIIGYHEKQVSNLMEKLNGENVQDS